MALETQEMECEIVDLTLMPDLVDMTSPRKKTVQEKFVSARDAPCIRPWIHAALVPPDVHMPVRAHFVW